MKCGKLIPLFCLIFCFSCTKEYQVEKHTEQVVQGNSFGTPDWISENQIRNFVYKLSLDLRGDQPTDAWLNQAIQDLKDADFSKAAKEGLIQSLLNDESFRVQFYQISTDRFLEGVGRNGILQTHAEYKAILAQFEANNQQIEADFFRSEIRKMEKLIGADSAFILNKTIGFTDYIIPFINNGIYDNINMGSENFVVSCYQHIYNRYPTTVELQSGVTMVDGGNSSLYSRNGNSKTDFISIFSGSPEFLSGNIRWLELVWLREYVEDDYHWYLVELYQSTADFEALIVELLSSTYYAKL
ncbi:MAG: hypothetical protein ACI9YL_002160 [Luteibaculaceae bacterium]|jgi:hypothetical protein